MTISPPLSAQGTNSGTGATTSVVIPAGASVGNYALAIFMDGQGTSISQTLTSSGWSPVVSLVVPSTLSLLVWGKKLVTGDPGSTLTITSSLTTSQKRTFDVLTYAGATIGNSAIKQATTSSTAHTAATATAVNAGAWVVNVFVDKGSPASTGFTLPGNLTLRQQFEHAGGGAISSVVADDDNVGAGTVGGNTVTGTLATTNAVQATIVLEPGSAPNVPPTATVGADQDDIEPWSVVQIGGADTDTDGTIASVAWDQTAGAPVSLYSDAALTTPSTTAATVYYQAPATIVGTIVTHEKTVTDNIGTASVGTVSVTVLPVTERVVNGGQLPLRMFAVTP